MPIPPILAGFAIGQGILSLKNARDQGEASEMAAEFEAKQHETNARIADIQGEEAIRRGDSDAKILKSRTSQSIGARRAAAAAQGIDPDSGSAADLQESDRRQGEIDTLTLKNNAWREAWGFKVDAQNSRGNAMITRAAGQSRASNTMLAGGMQALDSGIKGIGMLQTRTK